MKRAELTTYLNNYLDITSYQDYSPNGLQVQGREDISNIVTGVTACQALLDKAVTLKADAVLVHHGYFWKSEPQTITGFKYSRIRTLIENGINLYGYHLPLDGHPEIGNNALLGKLWGLKDITPSEGLVRLGVLEAPMAIDSFVDLVESSLEREALHLPGGPDEIKRVAWCSGGAQGYIDQAIAWGADVYISGEVSEHTTHLAKEGNIHYLAAGHHATEIHGIKALGETLASKFGLNCTFVDINNPV